MTAPPSERARAVAALLVVGLLWSTAGALIKYVDWPPAAIWGLRSAIAATALIAMTRHERVRARRRPRTSPRDPGSPESLLTARQGSLAPGWRGLTATEVASALALAATTGLFILANKWTSAANAILIQYSAPAWAALLAAIVLHERATRVDWLAIALALAGVSLFFVDKLAFDHTTGNAVALIAGITFATNVVLLRKLARDPAHGGRSALRAMILGNVLAAVIGLPFVVTAPALPAAGWAAMLALGLVQQTLPTLLYAYAIVRVTAVEGLLIPIVEPIASPLWVWLLFAERPGPWALLGGAIVILAVTLRGLAPGRA